jgi:hypothetical protein
MTVKGDGIYSYRSGLKCYTTGLLTWNLAALCSFERTDACPLYTENEREIKQS